MAHFPIGKYGLHEIEQAVNMYFITTNTNTATFTSSLINFNIHVLTKKGFASSALPSDFTTNIIFEKMVLHNFYIKIRRTPISLESSINTR